jgi:hypothetical protein
MSPDPLQWIDQAGTAHQLRSASDLSSAERGQLDLLHQQFQLSTRILDAGYTAPMVAQARPTMMRKILRVLLPDFAEEEIKTFDITKGLALITQWWAIADAMAYRAL